MAWKTGTSYGKRDAWAVGFDDHLLYVVWLGNFSGAGADALTGADMATPLLFRLAELNPRAPLPQAPAPPPGYTERQVCRQSGLLPDTFCHATVRDAYLPGVSSTVRCTHRTLIWVDDTPAPRHSYCPHCLPPTGVCQRWFDTPPVEQVEFLRRQSPHWLLPPPHNPGCTARRRSRQLRILFPLQGATYHLPHPRATLYLRARAPLATRRVSWFIDGRYVGSCSPDEAWPWPATPGTHTLTLTDDAGNAQTLTCTVLRPSD
jgi:penicillin-binding protein 1C